MGPRLAPLPSLTTPCEPGFGLTACPILGLLVVSNGVENTLGVFALPPSLPAVDLPNLHYFPLVDPDAECAATGPGLRPVATLGRSPALRFLFSKGGGCLAFATSVGLRGACPAVPPPSSL